MKLILTGTLLLCICFALAQRLPDVQQQALKAPQSVKVDGKMDEWDPFNAFNRKVLVAYSIANDDEKLYFAIQADDITIINKILRGGIIITINANRKSEKNAASITFPFISTTEGNRMRQEAGNISRTAKVDSSNVAATTAKVNELRKELNHKNIDRLKDLRVLGIKQVSNTLISIYNEEGISARAAFDTDGYYNYELAIPLSFLLTPHQQTFNYNIKLPVPPRAATADVFRINGSPPPGPGKRGANALDSMNSTDFWGTYTLIH